MLIMVQGGEDLHHYFVKVAENLVWKFGDGGLTLQFWPMYFEDNQI
jgi:hypothetical protein